VLVQLTSSLEALVFPLYQMLLMFLHYSALAMCFHTELQWRGHVLCSIDGCKKAGGSLHRWMFFRGGTGFSSTTPFIGYQGPLLVRISLEIILVVHIGKRVIPTALESLAGLCIRIRHIVVLVSVVETSNTNIDLLRAGMIWIRYGGWSIGSLVDRNGKTFDLCLFNVFSYAVEGPAHHYVYKLPDSGPLQCVILAQAIAI